MDETPGALSALEADLVRDGVRLRWLGDGTGRFTWRDLIVLVEHRREDSALSAVLSDGESIWGLEHQLLAGVVDQLAGIAWQNGGGKGPKPKPLPRPGVSGGRTVETSRESVPEGNPFNKDESGVFRGEAVPIGELNEWLGWV